MKKSPKIIIADFKEAVEVLNKIDSSLNPKIAIDNSSNESFKEVKSVSIVKTSEKLDSYYLLLFAIKKGFDLYPTAERVFVLSSLSLKDKDFIENTKADLIIYKGKNISISKELFRKLKDIGLFNNIVLAGNKPTIEKLKEICRKLNFSLHECS